MHRNRIGKLSKNNEYHPVGIFGGVIVLLGLVFLVMGGEALAAGVFGMVLIIIGGVMCYIGAYKDGT